MACAFELTLLIFILLKYTAGQNLAPLSSSLFISGSKQLLHFNVLLRLHTCVESFLSHIRMSGNFRRYPFGEKCQNRDFLHKLFLKRFYTKIRIYIYRYDVANKQNNNVLFMQF